MTTNELIEDLRVFRVAAGLTQRELAHDMGVPYRTLQDWLGGKKTPSAAAQSTIRTYLFWERNKNA